jgi:hypothetical protein
MPNGHFGEFVLLDYSEKASTMRFYFGAITAVSIGGFLTQFGALRTALGGITIGTIQKERWVGDETVLDNTPPTDFNAVRELAWLVEYEGASDSRGLHTCRIATPDTGKTYPGSDIADYTDPDIVAFITAFEALVVDPVTNVNVVVTEMFLIGQNR